MDAIEAMRNCCAHSRRPSKKVEENYLNARPLLDQLLDGYLARWEWFEPGEEMPWDSAAREAAERAMRHAFWDDENREITLFDADDDRMRWTVRNMEDLEHRLAEIIRSAFYAYAPRDEGEFVFECNEDEIVWAALAQYEEKLEEFFGGEA